MLNPFLDHLTSKYKVLQLEEGDVLMEQVKQVSQLKQFWALVLINIVIIACLGGLLVLMSNETAYMILSAGITFCAAAVIGVSGYSCWYLASLNNQVSLVADSVNRLEQGVLITDTKGTILYYNHKLKRILGGIGHLPLDVFTEKYISEGSTKEFLRLRKLAHEGQEAVGHIDFSGEHSSLSGWVVKIMPLKASHTVLWTFEEDSSDFIYNEGKVTQPFTNFRSIFEHAPMGVVLLDKDCKVRASNKFFRDELYKGAVSIDKPFYELLHSSCRDQVIESLARIMEGEKIPLPLEIKFENESSPEISAFASRIENRSPDHPEDPKSTGVILHFFDNSQQKRLHLQLVQSQKMQAMGQLAGGIAHDFNNLLTAMIGFCDLLLLRHSPGDQSFTDIMQVKQNANRAANLVRQLLAFSKQQTLKPQMLNITEILSEITVLLQRLVGVNIELEIKHGRELGLIKADKGQFEQVIINLVVNSRDAIIDQGKITIRTYNKTYTEEVHIHHDIVPPGSYVVIEVEDTGSGISKENLTRIFDPFFSTKELGRGTGLGLSTVYGIVKQTGGYILLDSEIGKGTRFKVIFPYYDSVQVIAELDKEKKKVDTGDLTGSGNILFVEDEDAVRLFGARALRDKGYRVIEARDGEEALNYIRSVVSSSNERIDLMITDVVMPVMDGVELVKKAHDIMPSLTIVYISGYAEDSFRQKVGQEETIHFLPKPFSLKELARKVKDVLQQKSQDEQNYGKG